MKLLMVFGSQSDRDIYQPLQAEFSKDHQLYFEVLSAHRHPQQLRQLIASRDFDFCIAGAGLAAHLPGVVASLTEKQVFGIPVAANFQGLDAFLSIVQMPFGVPVLTCAPGREREIVRFLNNLPVSEINLVVSAKLKEQDFVKKELQRVQELVEENELEFKISQRAKPEVFNIILASEFNATESPAIYVPMFADKNDPSLSLKIFDMALQGGLWVGLNNVRNAILSFIKINQER